MAAWFAAEDAKRIVSVIIHTYNIRTKKMALLGGECLLHNTADCTIAVMQ
jgi:hypothetical protein